MSHHIIHKQKVIVNIPDINNAFNYQNTLSNLFANGLSSAIEHVLDEAYEPNTIIRIAKLDLDLGNISAENFETDFKEKLLNELTHSIHTINKQGANVTVAKQSESLREAFIYFIRKGVLPWFTEVKNIADFEAEIFNKWSANDWIYVTGWLRKNILNSSYIIERLVLQFSNVFLIRLFIADKKLNEEEGRLFFNDISYVHGKLSTAQEKEHLIYLFKTFFNQPESSVNVLAAEVLLQIIIKENKANSLKTLLNDSVKKFKSSAVAAVVKNIRFLYENNISLNNITPADLLFENINEAVLLEKMNRLSPAKNKITTDEIIKIDKKLAAQKSKLQNDNKDVLFCDNCGIVLLHPFFKPYFEDLKLAGNKTFISEAAQKRAVLLLHYLSTGLTEAAEFNLVLQKVLCGYISEESLPATIELSQQEIDESTKLLQSVINYWPPLKKTSIEGLRNTFLQRKGKLIQTENGWQLTVEQKTVDILIDKLPWGFSTIKLPWMHALLNVDWY